MNSYKVSGFNSPLFATFAQEMQSFSFYETQVQISGQTFINPLAFGGTRRYLFILEDSTFVGQDTVYHIRFRPRKGKSFEGMKGILYINTNGYAIDKVIAEAAEPNDAFSVKIIQEYAFEQDKKWFPKKLSSELDFSNSSFVLGDSLSAEIKAISHTYIRSVEFSPEDLKKRQFDNTSVIVDENANQKAEEEWNGVREYELTEQEKNTYFVIDSVAKANNLSKFEYAFEVLSSGKIPLKYVNMPLNRLYSYNGFEKSRVGLGLETSSKVSKHFLIGGYFAYGTYDKEFKWGGNAEIFLTKRKDLRLLLDYQDDVLERGGRNYIRDAVLLAFKQLHFFYFLETNGPDKEKLKLPFLLDH